MFRNLSQQLAAAATGKNEAPKAIAPSLRSDIYSSIDQTKSWLVGGLGGGAAGDGVSLGPIISTIQKHFPSVKVGLDAVGQAEGEVALVVGGVTNMILEMSKWDGMAGGMAMRTWVDALVDGHAKASPGAGDRKDMIARGITRGVNQNTDVTLMTREFAPRIQLISTLKVVASRIYGPKSDEARQGEAFWSSKFI